MSLSINIKDTILKLEPALVMGILNITKDSFYDGGRYNQVDAAIERAMQMVDEGAGIIDVGGYSSRPGADEMSISEEIDRVVPVIEALVKELRVPLSIDTFRASVAKAAIAAGAHVVNDISAGEDDMDMLATVASLQVPYIAMHKQGTPKTMQLNPVYEDVVTEVYEYFLNRIRTYNAAGVKQVILDPGFGFGKTVAHNYELLNNLQLFKNFNLPILAGISRKSMINKVLGVKAKDALNGTTFLHAFCLQKGAHILRVHDVKEAVQAIQLYQELQKHP